MPESTSDKSDPRRSWRRLWSSPSTWVGAVILGCVGLVVVFADLLAPFNPREADPGAILAAPTSEHLLGTDQYGYDVLSRLLHGSRLSVTAGLLSMALAIVVGACAGATAGYLGGWVDSVVMRTIDVFMSFPGILIAILVVLSLDRTAWYPIMIAVGLINIPGFCRQVRATVLTQRNLEYVLASRAMGAGHLHILGRVILPGIVSPVVVLTTMGLGVAILEVAGFSFLGLAGQPDDPEWGSMLATAKDYVHVSIWPVLAPGIAISVTVLGCNLLGDGLRDALDPHLV